MYERDAPKDSCHPGGRGRAAWRALHGERRRLAVRRARTVSCDGERDEDEDEDDVRARGRRGKGNRSRWLI